MQSDLEKFNSNLPPDLQEYCRQRSEAARRLNKWFQESMDRVRLMYPLPEVPNGSNNVCDIPNDRLGTDSGKDSGE